MLYLTEIGLGKSICSAAPHRPVHAVAMRPAVCVCSFIASFLFCRLMCIGSVPTTELPPQYRTSRLSSALTLKALFRYRGQARVALDSSF